ncbi:BZ3500_MvSof-1268-A1-R1_Chr6-2g08505 [Microbotryum saponariae]|uniref:RBR-type E3 ubiquitin transferase n=1 Tax=Microbotryum saponariae TaxID=289078 RepID=A0A2X0MGB3_9BASI|nr:BZ3500_MvSof-1268-A1-R1_Chr6-2g08505 [Microbotryum saponariae]SDA07782.1 BZ3501_MvSof-1269-A2-R1_Chr6-1g08219 [Microbotryum saponariae]
MSDEEASMSELSDDYSDAADDFDEDMEQGYDDDSELSEGFISDSGFSPLGDPSSTCSTDRRGSLDPKGKGKARASNISSFRRVGEVEFRVLSSQELKDEQSRAVDYVADMLKLKPEGAAVLLRYFAWKKEKLLEAYMEDSEGTLAKAGIQESGSQPRLKRVRGFECSICYDDSNQETLALSCDHRFCKACYFTYVMAKINDEGESRRIQCMGNDCNVIVDERTVELLADDDTLARYRSLLNRTYVDDNNQLRWCPAPNCDYAIECNVTPRQLNCVIPTVECACSHMSCFGCGEADHRPCVCPIVKRWLKKCADDSETSNWIQANTKECTKCNSTIEKNGGCNHMTCKRCQWEFCWVCMGPWSDHGTAWYNCARFEEKGEKGIEDVQSKSRASLKRYLHYYNRYANHEQSIKLEKELALRTEKKMDEMQEHSTLSWIEVQFLAKAVQELTRARTILKWTYAMTFYLAKNNQTQMFEDNQNDLEQAVESLAELVERPLEEDKIAQLRQQTTDRTVYVAKRCKVLLEDTLRGYDEQRWIWADPIKL